MAGREKDAQHLHLLPDIIEIMKVNTKEKFLNEKTFWGLQISQYYLQRTAERNSQSFLNHLLQNMILSSLSGTSSNFSSSSSD